MTPTTQLTDPALPVGKSWTDPSGHVTIKTNSVSSTYAKVTVTLR
jgi:hypothetical protein